MMKDAHFQLGGVDLFCFHQAVITVDPFLGGFFGFKSMGWIFHNIWGRLGSVGTKMFIFVLVFQPISCQIKRL